VVVGFASPDVGGSPFGSVPVVKFYGPHSTFTCKINPVYEECGDTGFEGIPVNSSLRAASRWRASIPLVAADAMTIHKAVGSNLDYGVIDCAGGFHQYHHLYEALSRFRTLDDIQILHYEDVELQPLAFSKAAKKQTENLGLRATECLTESSAFLAKLAIGSVGGAEAGVAEDGPAEASAVEAAEATAPAAAAGQPPSGRSMRWHTDLLHTDLLSH
jgi:hypothetical protein